MVKIIFLAVVIGIMGTNAVAKSDLESLKKQVAVMSSKIEALEAEQSSKNVSTKKVTVVKSKVPVLKLSGKDYLSFVSDKAKGTNKFESRRNYLQVKGYFAENPKDYFRITLDTHQEDSGEWNVRLKYAYLYMDDIFPFTGVEVGQAHRPWIDYEEHHGWFYRSISKVMVEDKKAANFTNSADLGINFKTKMEYFSSELGIFNGEGYHGKTQNNKHLSGEWRLTGHILGTGQKHVHKSDSYADISFFGQHNTDYKERGKDFNWYGIHAVYNQKAFLLSAQYVKATDGGVDKEGKGWSVNGSYRFIDDWNIFGRHDSFDLDSGEDRTRNIAGIAYKYNKNVEFSTNYLREEVKSKTVTDAIMLTTEINW